MKKFGMYLMMIAITTMVLVSCENKDKDKPVITIAEGADSILINVDQTVQPPVVAFSIPVTVTSADEDLISIEAFVTVINTEGNSINYSIEKITTFSADPRAWTKTYVATDATLFNLMLNLMMQGMYPVAFGVTAIAKDVDPVTVTKPIKINIAVPAPVPLSEAKSFEWHRVGSTAGTGLDVFGLAWTSQTTSNIVITPLSGCRLVKLDKALWGSLTTQEELKLAVDNGTELTNFTEIPTKTTKQLDILLATKTAEGKYFLLHLTERIVDDQGGAPTFARTVKGQYKE